MNRKSTNLKLDLSVWFLLVVAAVVAAPLFDSLPNFAPFAAVALFAGFFFRSVVLAITAPLAAKVISDIAFETSGAEPLIIVAVYGCLVAPVALRQLIRKAHAAKGNRAERAAIRMATLTASALGCSILFFTVTNLAVWSTWYEPTASGLWACYLSALPFFRYTVFGDLFFAFALFGGFELAAFAAVKRSSNPNRVEETRSATEKS